MADKYVDMYNTYMWHHIIHIFFVGDVIRLMLWTMATLGSGFL